MGFPRQEDWSGLPFLSPGNYPDPGMVPMSPVWQADSLPLSHLGNPCIMPEASSKPALELSAKSPEILGLVYREESGRDSEERNLKGLLQKCLF